MSDQKQNTLPGHKTSNQRVSPPRWPDIPSALNDPLFPIALTQQCARFSRDPEDVAGSTLVILCRPTVIDRYDPCRGSVMTLSVGIAWRVDANMRRRQARMRTGLKYEPCTIDDSFLQHLMVREHLELMLAEIRTWPAEDEDLIWHAAHFRYSRLHSPLTDTERSRLHRLRRRLEKLID